MRSSTRLFHMLAIALMLAAPAAYSQRVTAEREAEFIEDALEDNAEEIAMLELGMDKGTDAELKKHAAHMLADHRKMDSTLRNYMTRKNVQIMGEIDMPDAVGIGKIIDLKIGKNWDEEWADEVGDMHRKLIARFERALDYVADVELKTIINNALPVLRSHRDMAIALERRLDAEN